MASIYDFGLFSAKCGGCGKEIKTTAYNRQGDTKPVFCNRVCETKAKGSKFPLKNIVRIGYFQ